MQQHDTHAERKPNARARACTHVARQVTRFPNLAFGTVRDQGLDQRDAAFAHAIVDAVTRRWLTLEFLLQRGLRKPIDQLEPRVRAALMVGAAQIVCLDRAPVWAAVDESVGWVKSTVRPGAGGLVNAALRRLAELVCQGTSEGERQRRDVYEGARDEVPLQSGGALVLTEPAMPKDAVERLVAATSHPARLIAEWAKSMTRREVRKLAIHGVTRPPVILNVSFAKSPIPQGLTKPHAAPGHAVFAGAHAELATLLEQRDDLWAQDPASSLAVESAEGLDPRLVIDLCAGKGTKARQLAHAFPGAQIVATDIDRARYATLAQTFPEGKTNVSVVPFETIYDAYAGKADLVLVDAPCSNSGVLARRVEARYRPYEKTVEELVRVQRQLIADAIRLLAPGAADRGGILYSTCSMEPRENEEHVLWAKKWHGMNGSRTHRRQPAGGPGEPPERYTDGSFAALLR